MPTDVRSAANFRQRNEASSRARVLPLYKEMAKLKMPHDGAAASRRMSAAQQISGGATKACRVGNLQIPPPTSPDVFISR
jgi:hypothetical protein